MSAKALILFITTLLQTGDPRVKDPDPYAPGIDLRVRELHTDKVPTSYQITLTYMIP